VRVCKPTEVTVTLKWGEGVDESLVIPQTLDADTGLWWSEMQFPEWNLRYGYAPPSDLLPGNVLLSAVEDSGAIPMLVVAQGVSLADLEAQKALLRTALGKWTGTITVLADPGDPNDSDTVIGGPWTTLPTVPQWSDGPNPLKLEHLFAEAIFSIPVQPLGV